MKNIIIRGLIIAALLTNGINMKAQNIEPKLNDAPWQKHEEFFREHFSELKQTDPELIGIIDNFLSTEVLQYGDLDPQTRLMAILASTIACQAPGQYKVILGTALEVGITPVQAKEILYQAVPYVGISKVLDFIDATNVILVERGITLPLERQSVSTPGTRWKRGLTVQKEIFGESIDSNYENSPDSQIHIQRFLSANCFGDFVSRDGLDLRTREMLTFSMLLSIGGCEPQLKGHIQGNLNVGNDKEFLLAVVTQLIPYVGYPRALNAIACLNEVIPE